MSSAMKRLSELASHFVPSSTPNVADKMREQFKPSYHIHQLSPTVFLPRAASIEPDVSGTCPQERCEAEVEID